MYQEQKLLFSKDHEWVFVEGETAVIGISSHAEQSLGDIVYIELPKLGQAIEAGKTIGSIESVKAVSEFISPLSGKVIELNTTLAKAPETVNQEPYGQGWMIKITPTKPDELKNLMDHAAYQTYVKNHS